MKKWLEKNRYVEILFIAFLIMGVAFLVISHDETTYQDIEIKNGDTLWTLAEQYRGKMTINEWIHKVKNDNNLTGETIVAGNKLTVVVHEKSLYAANIEKGEDLQAVEVAIKNQ